MPSLKTALGVAGGIALFGLIVFGIRMLPSNAVTSPVKKVVDIATTR